MTVLDIIYIRVIIITRATLRDFVDTILISSFNFRFFWLAIVIASGSSALYLILASYRRFQNDPLVISLDRNHRLFETFLPAISLCFVQKLNETIIAPFVKK